MADPVDADSIARAAAQPASASADGQSAEAHSISEQKIALLLKQAQEAAAGTNANGGPKTGWGAGRWARGIPQGPV